MVGQCYKLSNSITAPYSKIMQAAQLHNKPQIMCTICHHILKMGYL